MLRITRAAGELAPRWAGGGRPPRTGVIGGGGKAMYAWMHAQKQLDEVHG